MGGEETPAQVNREIAHPKLKNLEPAGFVIFIYSLVFTSRPAHGREMESFLLDTPAELSAAPDETELFSGVVSLAEKAGKHVELMVVPGADPMKLRPSRARRWGRSGERLPEPRPSLSLELFLPEERRSIFFNLGSHPPRLWPEDLDRDRVPGCGTAMSWE